MIIITGAAGFIGSCLIAKLNEEGYHDLIAVDDFGRKEKESNLLGKSLSGKVDRDDFFSWLGSNHRQVELIFHLGARTDTTEFDKSIFEKLNTGYSKKMWMACTNYGIPLIYASSAATYGDGAFGYSDDHHHLSMLKPLNPYGESKHEFDIWALEQEKKPFFWAGLKFFNVYGPNEYHKGRMASVIYHAYGQIKNTGKMKLFRSHRPDFADGGQLRDFIYVKDLTEVCLFMMQHRKHSGIYNLGTGRARTFVDLAKGLFHTLGMEEQIEFIDTPEDIRDKYQYFTEAKMEKLYNAGYTRPFTSLEEGIHDYVTQYLSKQKNY
jgi:ADP-L-glycero-D-manno-heptose 6-epimerase